MLSEPISRSAAGSESTSRATGPHERLDSWKEIASFLGRTVRTVQRWERCEGLPVRRHVHLAGSSVYAYTSELERWLSSRVETGVLEGSSRSERGETAREGYFHYIRGQVALRKRTLADTVDAVREFEASLGCDASWAPAYAGLAEAYVVLSVIEWYPPSEGFPKVLAAAEGALAINPKAAVAHAAMGIVAAFYRGEWNVANEHFARALRLEPQSTLAHYWYGMVLTNQGRFADAIAELEHAAALDPSSAIIVANIGRPSLCSGDFHTAARYFRLALELQPSFWLAEVFMGWVHEACGDFGEAISCFERAVQASDAAPVATSSLAHAHALAGHREAAEKILRGLLSSDAFVPPVRIARIYAGLGLFEEALRWLARARDTGSLANNVYVRYDRAFAPLTSDPRFQDILRSRNV